MWRGRGHALQCDGAFLQRSVRPRPAPRQPSRRPRPRAERGWWGGARSTSSAALPPAEELVEDLFATGAGEAALLGEAVELGAQPRRVARGAHGGGLRAGV